jgi:hypothetical protein
MMAPLHVDDGFGLQLAKSTNASVNLLRSTATALI